tara:strand:- start:32547 stop:32702 length:156 start_codon:yes stop_codon:yes gene_type:complete
MASLTENNCNPVLYLVEVISSEIEEQKKGDENNKLEDFKKSLLSILVSYLL